MVIQAHVRYYKSIRGNVGKSSLLLTEIYYVLIGCAEERLQQELCINLRLKITHGQPEVETGRDPSAHNSSATAADISTTTLRATSNKPRCMSDKLWGNPNPGASLAQILANPKFALFKKKPPNEKE